MFTLFECATLALLDYLYSISADVRHPVVPVDLNESRRVKMQKFYDALPRNARGTSENVFIIADIADSPNFLLQLWHGCHTVLEA